MAGGLKGTLYAVDPDNGQTQAFPPGTSRSDLPRWVKVDDGAFEETDDSAAEVAGGVGSGEPGDTGDGGGGSSSYDGMNVGQLKDEIRARNEVRAEDDQLSLDGKKADLVARLDADDEAQA